MAEGEGGEGGGSREEWGPGEAGARPHARRNTATTQRTKVARKAMPKIQKKITQNAARAPPMICDRGIFVAFEIALETVDTCGWCVPYKTMSSQGHHKGGEVKYGGRSSC